METGQRVTGNLGCNIDAGHPGNGSNGVTGGKGCVIKAREKLVVTRKCDSQFGLAVHQAIEWYNLGRWHGTSPVDPNIPEQRNAVSRILERNVRNWKYFKSKKEKKKLLKAASPVEADKENSPSHSNRQSDDENSDEFLIDEPNTDCTITNVGDQSRETPSRPRKPRLTLTTNDLVMVVDEKQTAICAAQVESPFLTNDDDLDFDHVEILVLQTFSGSYIIGDLVCVHVNDVIYIPQSYAVLADNLIEKNRLKCLRGQDCRLEVGGLVLLELNDKYLDQYPLIGKITNLCNNRNKMTVQWYWRDDSQDQPLLAIDGPFAPWKPNGKAVYEENIPTSSHYFCRFDLENGVFPKSAKLACKKNIDN